MIPFKIDSAPGKNLIPEIISENHFNDLYEFYKLRVDYYEYPLIHDRLTTYGIFEDLKYACPKNVEIISKFIDYSIEIANKETDERLINSILIILDFFQRGRNIYVPNEYQIQKIIELTPRAKELSSVSNLVCFWNQILDFCKLPKIAD